MSSEKHRGQVIRRAKASTIQDKFLVGYQGWFTCGGDGEPVGPGHHGWLHWLTHPISDGGRPNTDLWPDVSEYSPSELFPVTGLRLKNGETPFLFSSRHPKTVQRHFNWMAQHGVDGAFLQRFAGQTDMEKGNEGIRRIRDEVGDRVREAAEKEGRVFAIMYDVSGVPPGDIERVIKQDWVHLIRTRAILDSPNYLREKGRPVVALWGFGFNGSGHCPHVLRGIIHFIRNNTPGGAYIMAGTPAYWRTASDDADRNPEFLEVWLNEFDAISPWMVGRFGNEAEAEDFFNTKSKGDVELLNTRAQEGHKKVDYIPVVLPGGSGFNLSEGKWKYNGMKRNGGKFLWTQIINAKRLGVRTMYGAMWDEYDEGTAFMPVVSKAHELPVTDKWPFLALDGDGFDLPPDWYMRICGFAAEALHGERRLFDSFPVKELQDYWSCRPKYEEVNFKGSEFVSGSSSTADGGDGETYEEWLAGQKDTKDEPPPPPYSLEASEPEAQDPPSTNNPATVDSVPAQPAHTQQVAEPPRPNVSTRPLPMQGNPVPETNRPPTTPPAPIPQASTRPFLPPVPNTASRPPAPNMSSPIETLTNDFGNQRISPPPVPNSVRPGISPPPRHPSLPKVHSPNIFPQPQTQLPSEQFYTHQPPTSPAPATPYTSAPPRPPSRPQSRPPGAKPSTPQWPPPEWGNAPKPHSPGNYSPTPVPNPVSTPFFPQAQTYDNSSNPLAPYNQYYNGPQPGNYPHHSTHQGQVAFPDGVVAFPQASMLSPGEYSQSGQQSLPSNNGPYSYQAYRPHAHGTPSPAGSSGGSSSLPQPQTTPPVPSRPGSNSPPSSSVTFPLGGAAMDYAVSAIDKVAGKQNRERLESKASSLVNSGSKLFSKFTK